MKKFADLKIKVASIINLLLFALVILSCEPEKPVIPPNENLIQVKPPLPVLEYSIVATFPHDTTAFTEGLLIHDGKLFESTGSPDYLPKLKSVIGISDLKTGKLDIKVELDKKSYPFGEGMVILNGKIYQVTYKEQTGFIYDAKTFNRIGQFSYTNKEGWGMTTDGTNIIMSDGTNYLTYLDPTDFKVVKVLSTNENGYASDDLNELEYINGFIYANVWMTGNIVKIDPATGNIVAKINFTPLSYQIKNFHPNALEMNGIAYDSINDKIYVTGKLWPKIYQVNFPH